MSPQEQAAQLARETRSSIELTRNAKGDYQWTIKQYHEQGEHAAELAMEVIAMVDAQLREEYLPRSSE